MDSNPQGLINVGISENSLMRTQLLNVSLMLQATCFYSHR